MLSNTSRSFTYLTVTYTSYAPIIFITALFASFGLFDFARKPGQFICAGAYFLVGLPILFVLLREGTGLRRA